MMTRRRFVQSTALAAGTGTSPTLFAADTKLVVETNHGKVRGLFENGIKVFKGLRYGATTAGKNRFLPPRAVTPWSNVAEAHEYGASTVQARFGVSGNEDCLFLNVWTPSINDNVPFSGCCLP